MLINEIITDSVEVKRANLESPMLSKKSLEQQIGSYNSSFWKNYNIVKENPLDRKLVKLIEQDVKIEKQFMTQKADPTLKSKKPGIKKKQGKEDPDDEL